MPKRITAFAGSNSSVSINRQLVAFALSYFKEHDIHFLDLNDYEMPLFSIDREKSQGFPAKAYAFRKELEDADAIICSLAEHNRSYTVAFKNIFDWCSRIDLNIFRDKPMLLMSTSPGGFGGGNVMNAAKSFFPKCGARITGTFSLPSFRQHFSEGRITDDILRAELETRISSFKSILETPHPSGSSATAEGII